MEELYCSNCEKNVEIKIEESKFMEQTIYKKICSECGKMLSHTFNKESI